MNTTRTGNIYHLIDSIKRKYGYLPPGFNNLVNMPESLLSKSGLLYKLEYYLQTKRRKKSRMFQKGGKIKMAEEKKQDFEIQFFQPCESFRRKLSDVYEGNVVTVEFCCCNFLKKATGCLTFVGNDAIELVGANQGPVEINIFGPTGTLEPEFAFRVLIPLERVCGVELLSTPPCPPCPPCPPKKPWNTDEE